MLENEVTQEAHNDNQPHCTLQSNQGTWSDMIHHLQGENIFYLNLNF